jgi:hypothetical protein
MAAELRARIDRALAACEETNLTGPQRPPRWVLELIAELQTAHGSLVWEPADTADAHAELLDLQVHHLDVPPAAALADALGQLAHARREVRRLRNRQSDAEAAHGDRAPKPAAHLAAPAVLGAADEVRRELVALRSMVDQAVRELRAHLDRLSDEVAAVRTEAQPAAGADTVALPPNLSLSAAVAAARHATKVASQAELEEIAGAAGTTLAELRGPSTRRALVEIRRIAARYLRERGCSLPEIGAALNRDHTSILHLLRTPARSAGRAA